MTKAEIVRRICEKNGISNSDAINIVETTFEVIKASLERGEKIKISKFGNFSVRGKNERRGRNPITGAEIFIAARKVVTFSPSPAMKNALNNIASD
jgi:integration host factor subunit alpha